MSAELIEERLAGIAFQADKLCSLCKYLPTARGTAKAIALSNIEIALNNLVFQREMYLRELNMPGANNEAQK